MDKFRLFSLLLFYFRISQAVISSIYLNSTVVQATNCPFFPSCLTVTWFTDLNSTSIFLTSPLTSPYTVIINNTVNPLTSINSGTVSYCYPFVFGTNFTFALVDDSTGRICAVVPVTTIQLNVICPALPIKTTADPLLSDAIAMVLDGDIIYLTSTNSFIQEKISFSTGRLLSYNNVSAKGSKTLILFGQTLIIPSQVASSSSAIFHLDTNMNQVQTIPSVSTSTYPYGVAALGFNSSIIYVGYNDGFLRVYDFGQYPARYLWSVGATVGIFGYVLTAPGFFVTCGISSATDLLVKKWALNGNLLNSFVAVLGCITATFTESYDAIIIGNTRLIKYDLNTGSTLVTLTDPLLATDYATMTFPTSLNVSGNYVFLTAADTVIRQWDHTTGNLVCRYYGGYNFRQILFNGSYILALSSGQITQYWMQNSCIDQVLGNPNLVYQTRVPSVIRSSYKYCLATVGNGLFLTIVGSPTVTAVLYNPIPSGVTTYSVSVTVAANSQPSAIYVNGTIVFIGFSTSPYPVVGFSMITGTTILSLSGHTAAVLNILVVRSILVTAQMTTIKTWDPITWANTLNISNSGNNIGSIDTDSNLVYYQTTTKNIGVLDPVLQSTSTLPCAVSSNIIVMKYSPVFNYLVMTFSSTPQSLGYCNIATGNFVISAPALYTNQVNSKVSMRNYLLVVKDFAFLPFLDGSIQIHNFSLIQNSTLIRLWYATSSLINVLTYYNDQVYIGSDNGLLSCWNVPELTPYKITTTTTTSQTSKTTTTKTTTTTTKTTTTFQSITYRQNSTPSEETLKSALVQTNTSFTTAVGAVLVLAGIVILVGPLYYFRYQKIKTASSKSDKNGNNNVYISNDSNRPRNILELKESKLAQIVNNPSKNPEKIEMAATVQSNYEYSTGPVMETKANHIFNNNAGQIYTKSIIPTAINTAQLLTDDQINEGIEKTIRGKTIQSIKGGTTYRGNTLVDTENSSILSLPGHLQISSVDYVLGTKIGSGGGGDIYYSELLKKANLKISNETTVVAKVMKSGGQAAFIQEVSIMSLYKYQDTFATLVAYDLEQMILFMIYYPAGSIDTWLKTNGALSLMFQLINGSFTAINNLHRAGIVHNDIKTANILVEIVSPEIVRPRLTDFGVSNIVDKSSLKVDAFRVHNVRGLSTLYAAPERLDKSLLHRFDYIGKLSAIQKSADGFSMAVVICEMLNRKKPWRKEELLYE